jgi:hypothetical protein
MIQFNLLPDVKLQYIKAQRTKHTVVTAAVVTAAAAFGIMVLLFLVVNVWQHQQLNSLNKTIKQDTAKLKAIPDLDKVLTIQNQLNALPGLNDSKPVSSRFFGYLTQLTPSKATITQAKVDFDSGTITINGNADAISTVDKYVDTLKFTDYTVGGGSDKKKAFSDVVLTSFAKNDKGVTYQIDFKFDPTIFSSANDVTLAVPNIISTRSNTEKPTDLFEQSQTKKTQ